MWVLGIALGYSGRAAASDLNYRHFSSQSTSPTSPNLSGQFTNHVHANNNIQSEQVVFIRLGLYCPKYMYDST